MRLIHSLTFSTEYKLKLLMEALFRSLLKVGRSSTIVALGALCWSASPALLADTLITNASIVDGMDSAAVVGSVRLTGDRITAVGELAPGESEEVIDVGGLVLAPGFIDTHSHSDRLILTERDALASLWVVPTKSLRVSTPRGKRGSISLRIFTPTPTGNQT